MCSSDLMGINPASAAASAHASSRPIQEADKGVAYGATTELIISVHNRAFFKFSGPAVTFTNLVPAAPTQPDAH